MQGVVSDGVLALDTFIINNLGNLDFGFMCNGKVLYKSSTRGINEDNKYYLDSAKNKIIVSTDLNGKRIGFNCSLKSKIISKPEGYYCDLQVSDRR